MVSMSLLTLLGASEDFPSSYNLCSVPVFLAKSDGEIKRYMK